MFGGEHHTGWLPPGATTPPLTPARTALLDVRIMEEDAAYYLVWQSRNTDDYGDTWHLTVEEALAEAQRWFGIRPEHWTIVTS